MTDRDTKPANVMVELWTRLEQLEQRIGVTGKGTFFGDRLSIVETELGLFDRAPDLATRLARCEVRAERRHFGRVAIQAGVQPVSAIPPAIARRISDVSLEGEQAQAAMFEVLQAQISALPDAMATTFKVKLAEQVQAELKKAMAPTIEAETTRMVLASTAAAAKITKGKWLRAALVAGGAFVGGMTIPYAERVWAYLESFLKGTP